VVGGRRWEAAAPALPPRLEPENDQSQARSEGAEARCEAGSSERVLGANYQAD